MAIENTYRDLLIEDYIKGQLTQGTAVSAEEIQSELETLINNSDLSVPQFVAETYHTTSAENASATKHNNTFSAIKQDLRTLYKDMIALTKVSTNALERWSLEADVLEKKLVDLEERIENLLLVAQDTEGYHSFLVDNFSDTSQVDFSSTTAEVDLQAGVVELSPSSTGETRIFLNDLSVASDIRFKVRTSVNFVSRADATKSSLTNIFKQESDSWWTSIVMNKSKPVTCELLIKLTSETSIPLSKILIKLHDSTESSPMTITPLYSLDNINFTQVPSNTFTQEVRNSAVFSFNEVDAKYIKFLLTKKGPDSGSDQNFTYQFGFKEISFYQTGFTEDSIQTLISRPLWVAQEDGSAKQFEKLNLTVCERVEDDTEIKYYVTTSNDATVPLSPAPTWIPISPINRANPLYSTILVIGDTTETTIGDTETVTISYDSSGSTTYNPSRTFNLLSLDDSGTVQDDSITVSSGAIRYSFLNSNDRILNYQVKDTDYTGSGTGNNAIQINEESFVIFRNIGEQGLSKTSVSSKVRGIQRGWSFKDPWYSCVIEIQNPSGITIDVGDKEIIIDDVKYTNKIDEQILTGKTDTNSGIHRVKVHKINWKEVTSSLNTLAELKAADPLYPYNHKLLIEGYSYGSSWSDAEEKIYLGADLFAELVMKKASIFDLMNNIAADNYKMYALDRDAPDTHEGTGSNPDINNATRVFAVKIDEENPDSVYERFMIRFSLINQLRSYLRFRADLTTKDEKITPALHSYKIKLS